jgi:uncharacterized membrane protein
VAIVCGAHNAGDGEVIRALRVGSERTFEQDPALALRVLADIALRALSPAVNDPTTAVQTLDAIDALLRTLATCDLAVRALDGFDGTPRLVLKLPTWEDYVGVAVDEIISMGLASIQVRRRMSRLLEGLLAIAPPEPRRPLEDRLELARASGEARVRSVS